MDLVREIGWDFLAAFREQATSRWNLARRFTQCV